MSSLQKSLPEIAPDPTRSERDELPDDPRLMQAVEEYLNQLEAGQMPSRQDLLRRFPDLVEPLNQCLDGLELVHKATNRAKPPGSVPSPGAAGSGDVIPTNPLGDFQILGEIGRGGMGIVYEALQLSLGRRVALKVLPFAATFDAKHLQRFHNEAHAAAQLHHSNIVPVYAVGCERGVHFYAMQLIEGQSLSSMIQQLRQQTGRPEAADPSVDQAGSRAREQPTVSFMAGPPAQERHNISETIPQLSLALSTQRSNHSSQFFGMAARLIVQAAEALEHAHQYGIVHRDIKPANLMIDVHGRLWITDFGLAQFHADAGLTQTGDILGTLRYMSPEQASGNRVLLDHRTDVYSLGATLYELATLEPIFPGRNRHQLLQHIIHDEPLAPRLIDKQIPVEMETIILKAVNKNPVERYGSAQELAADLQRYLDDQPIQARRPTLVDRVRKWSRRHPAVVAAGILVLIVMLMGLLVNNWLVTREQAKTQTALKSEKDRAAEARRAVDTLVEVAEAELADNPMLQDVRRRLLETALHYYQDFMNTHGDDDASQAELEAGRNRVRAILNELATLQGAHLFGLAADRTVQADLKLADAQREHLAKLQKHFSEQRVMHFQEHRSLTPEERRKRFYEFAKTQEAALSEILQPHELRRLKQIELQLLGPRAFHDSSVVGVLKITPEQRRKFREFKEESMVQVFGRPPEKSKGGEFGKNHQRIQKAEVERIVAILTPEQTKLWQDLTGPTFVGSPRLSAGFPSPSGGFGPPWKKDRKGP